MKVLDAWAEFMLAAGSSPATVETRRRAITSLMGCAGVSDPLQLTRLDVLTWLARPRKQWTKVTYWASVRAFDRWLTEFDLGELNLVKGIPRPKTPDSVARPITDDVIDQLLALQLPRRSSAYVRLALYEGLRVHEIAKVRAEHFDFESGWLMVAGKGGIIAPVPIHDEIVAVAETMPEIGYWFPSRTRPTGHVSGITVSQTIGAALRSIGSMATAHQLRDTGATQLQQRVKDIRITQAFLRHKALASTMKYTAVNDQALRAAVRSAHWGRTDTVSEDQATAA